MTASSGSNGAVNAKIADPTKAMRNRRESTVGLGSFRRVGSIATPNGGALPLPAAQQGAPQQQQSSGCDLGGHFVEKVTHLDNFSYYPTPKIDNRYGYETFLGGLTTIGIATVVIWYTITASQRYGQHLPTIVQTNKLLDLTETSQVQYAFQLADSNNGIMAMDDRLFGFRIQQFHKNLTSAALGTEQQFRPDCPTDIPMPWASVYCPVDSADPSKNKLGVVQGSFVAPDFRYPKVEIFMCFNGTHRPVDRPCYSPEHIRAKLAGSKFNAIFALPNGDVSESYIDVQTHFWVFDHATVQKADVYFIRSTIYDYSNVWIESLQSPHSKQTLSFQTTDLKATSRAKSAKPDYESQLRNAVIVQFVPRLSPLEVTETRRYLSFTDLLSQIGGLLVLLRAVFGYFIYRYNRRSFQTGVEYSWRMPGDDAAAAAAASGNNSGNDDGGGIGPRKTTSGMAQVMHMESPRARKASAAASAASAAAAASVAASVAAGAGAGGSTTPDESAAPADGSPRGGRSQQQQSSHHPHGLELQQTGPFLRTPASASSVAVVRVSADKQHPQQAQQPLLSPGRESKDSSSSGGGGGGSGNKRSSGLLNGLMASPSSKGASNGRSGGGSLFSFQISQVLTPGSSKPRTMEQKLAKSRVSMDHDEEESFTSALADSLSHAASAVAVMADHTSGVAASALSDRSNNSAAAGAAASAASSEAVTSFHSSAAAPSDSALSGAGAADPFAGASGSAAAFVSQQGSSGGRARLPLTIDTLSGREGNMAAAAASAASGSGVVAGALTGAGAAAGSDGFSGVLPGTALER